MRLQVRNRRRPANLAVDPVGNGKMVWTWCGPAASSWPVPRAERDQPAGEIVAYTIAGMTNYEALKAATVNPAQALGLDAGVEAGKLADLIMVDGDRS
jgi:hypothetical protein